MANARSRKREIDKAKRERAVAKRERRQDRSAEPEVTEGGNGVVASPAGPTRSDEELLAELQALHERYDAEAIDFEEFEEARAELLSHLHVE